MKQILMAIQKEKDNHKKARLTALAKVYLKYTAELKLNGRTPFVALLGGKVQQLVKALRRDGVSI